MRLYRDALWVLIELMPEVKFKEILGFQKNSLSCHSGSFSILQSEGGISFKKDLTWFAWEPYNIPE